MLGHGINLRSVWRTLVVNFVIMLKPRHSTTGGVDLRFHGDIREYAEMYLYYMEQKKNQSKAYKEYYLRLECLVFVQKYIKLLI